MERPNILLIVLDAARADRLSCNGYHRQTTPHLDRFAEGGTVFERAYANGNITFPSHTSMFTGIHPYFTKAASNFSIYDGKYPTLAQILGAQGYTTIGISNNSMLSPQKGVHRGFQTYHTLWTKPGRSSSGVAGLARRLLARDNRLVRKLRAPSRWLYRKLRLYKSDPKRYEHQDKGASEILPIIIQELEEQRKQGNNVFLFANLLEAHGPFWHPLPYRHRYFEGPIPKRVLDAWYRPYDFVEGKFPFSPHDKEVLDALYDAGLNYLDDQLVPLWKYLEDSGMLDETMVIVTSDHGNSLGERGLISTGTSTFEEVVRVPLIIRYPKRFKAGRREERLVQLTDLFPTILAATDTPLERSVFNYQGEDLAYDPFQQSDREFLVVDDPPITFPERLKKYPKLLDKWNHIERAIITDEYKFVWSSSGRHRLHAIKEDPLEENNLYSQATMSQAEGLKTQMIEWYQKQLGPGEQFELGTYQYSQEWWDALDAGGDGHSDDADEMSLTLERLRDLGYIE